MKSNIWAAIQRKLGERPDGEPGAMTAAAVAVAVGASAKEALPGAGARFLWRLVQGRLGLNADGIPGDDTAAAVARFLHLELPARVMSKALWPKDRESDLRAFYGAPGSGQVQIVPPYVLYYEGKPMKHITVHSKIAAATMEALREVLDVYGQRVLSELELDQWDGCFNNRPKRNGRSLSVHAFTAAHDFCGDKNRLHQDHATALFAHEKYEPWWEAWERQGATSLGRERDFDWMHVQFANL